jgi:hypothetical protein
MEPLGMTAAGPLPGEAKEEVGRWNRFLPGKVYWRC